MTDQTSKRSREIEAELFACSTEARFIRFVNGDYKSVLDTLNANKMPLRRATVNFHNDGTFEFDGDTTAYLVPIYSIAPYGSPNDPLHPHGLEVIDIGAVDANRDKAATRYGCADFLGEHNYLYPPLNRELITVKNSQRWIQQGGFGICPITEASKRKLSNDNRGLRLVSNEDEGRFIQDDLSRYRPELAEVFVWRSV